MPWIDALRFLINTVFGLVVYTALLRFIMQWLRAPFRNPLGQATIALTDWAVKPMRRVVAGRAGYDWASLLVAWIAQALWIMIAAIFIQAILSWVAPDGPLAGVLNALTFRVLAPIRRVVPPIGGSLDLSPLIAIVLAQLILMLPVAWLEGALKQLLV